MQHDGTTAGIVRRVFTSMLAVAAVALFAGAAQAQDPDRVDKVSRSSFAETLRKVDAALQAEHMMVVARIDHKNMLSMIGTRIGGATTVEFGKPDMGKMLLPMNAAIGLEMPARIYVYETGDGRVIVSYRRSARQFAAYGPDAAKAGEMMDMTLDKIVGSITQ
ncbi:MAG: DUF302 domain-containing protein [Acidobacteriota bacterium]